MKHTIILTDHIKALVKLKFISRHWKMVVHFLLRTKRFGVNNEWWFDGDSMWGKSFMGKIRHVMRIRPVFNEYKNMKFRATACYFMNDEQLEIMGWKHEKNHTPH